jgi:uncharacterized protein
MKTASLSQGSYVIRLDPGDDIVAVIESFCSLQNINNAAVWGIGSIDDPTLAHYRIDTKKYTQKQLEGIYEITALMGNVAIYEGRPLAHVHVAISNEQMQGFGGHLVKGQVSAAAELVLRAYESSYEKALDEKIGLKLWQLPGPPG